MIKEADHAATLARAGFDVAPVTAAQTLGVPYLIKPFARGPNLNDVSRKGFSHAQIDGLAKVYVTGVRSGIHPDLLGLGKSNLIWEAEHSRWILVDAGPTTAPAYYQRFETLFVREEQPTSTYKTYYAVVFARREAETSRFQKTALELLQLAPP